MRRRSRFAIIASCAGLVLISVAWVRSHHRLDQLVCRAGSIHPPRDPAASKTSSLDALWRYDSRDRRLTNLEGVVSFSSSLYSSYDPDRDALERQWRDARGWHVESLAWGSPESSECGCDDGPPDAFWRSPIEWRCAGLGVYSWGEMGEETRLIEVPHWFLTLGAGTPAAWALFAAARARRRASRGQCPRCAYPVADLASPCPECGNASTHA